MIPIEGFWKIFFIFCLVLITAGLSVILYQVIVEIKRHICNINEERNQDIPLEVFVQERITKRVQSKQAQRFCHKANYSKNLDDHKNNFSPRFCQYAKLQTVNIETNSARILKESDSMSHKSKQALSPRLSSAATPFIN